MAARTALLADGWWGICEPLGRTLSTPVGAAGQAGVEELTNYLAKHTGRLNYRVRLHRGQAIGSGMVEGAAQQMIGRRMKQTGAR